MNESQAIIITNDVDTVITVTNQPAIGNEKIVSNQVKSNKSRIIIISMIVIIFIGIVISSIVYLMFSPKITLIQDPFRAQNLKKVIIITRHGAKSSFKNLPTDIEEPWKCDLPQLVSYENQKILLNDSTPKPCPSGQLVANGFKQHKELGKRWKENYIDTGFISKIYDKSEVYLRTTNTTRTHASLLGQLSILFPETEIFAVDQVYTKKDGFKSLSPCKWQDDFQAKIYQENATLFPTEPLSKINSALKTNWDYRTISETLNSILGRGQNLPKTINSDQFQLVQTANDDFWKAWFCNANTTRAATAIKVNVGPMFPVLRDMVANQPEKLFIVSAHDTTIAPLMSVLTGFKWACEQPKYAANVVIEVNLQGQVRVKYDGVLVATLGCSEGSYCSGDEFMGLLRGFDVDEDKGREELCKVKFD